MAKAQPDLEPPTRAPVVDSPPQVLPDDEPGFEYSDIETGTESFHMYPQTIPTGVAPSTGGPFPTLTGIDHPGGNWVFLKKIIGGETFGAYHWADVDKKVRAKGWQFYKSKCDG
jgi:hypothetical protein